MPDPDLSTVPNLTHIPEESRMSSTTSTPASSASSTRTPGRRVASWPVLLLAAPAFVAIWSGWVGLGALTGFGVIHPLPGIFDSATLNTAITLPVGVEAYAAYALRVWLTGSASSRAATFARRSAGGSLALGAGGQVAYHLMAANGVTRAPWQITAVVACLPVAVLGMGAALAHLTHHHAPDKPDPAALLERVGHVERDAQLEVDAPSTAARPVPGTVAGQRIPAPDRPARVARAAGSPRPASVTRRGDATGAAIARARQDLPGATTGQLAARVGVSERTVRRHLNPRSALSRPPTADPARTSTDTSTESTSDMPGASASRAA